MSWFHTSKRPIGKLLAMVVLATSVAVIHGVQRQRKSKTVPFASWIGRKFVFLDKFMIEDGDGPSAFTVTTPGADKRSLVSKLRGRTLECTGATREKVSFCIPDFKLNVEYHLFEKYNEDGSLFNNYLNYIAGLAPADELEKVKSGYLGKTVWAKKPSPREWVFRFDRTSNKIVDEFGSKPLIPAGTKLKVVRVEWGHVFEVPVWVIAKTDNDDSYCYCVAADRTNKHLPINGKLQSWLKEPKRMNIDHSPASKARRTKKPIPSQSPKAKALTSFGLRHQVALTGIASPAISALCSRKLTEMKESSQSLM